MALPRFSAGARVSLVGNRALSAPTGTYRIIRALPQERGPQQYQVRCEIENFERVVDEGRLEVMSVD